MKREDECTIQIAMCSDCGNKLTDIEVKMHDVMVLFKPHELWRMAQKYNCDDFIQKIEQSKSLNKL